MKKLLQGCRNFNRKAQREMVNYLSPYLYAICCRYTDNQEDTKDLLQEALILIFNNIDRCSSNEEGVFKSWCKHIAINNALSKKRKKGFLYEQINTTNIDPSIAPKIDSQLNVKDILNWLQYLPENQRLVFNLAIIDNYSHKEIAEILKIKESSSRTFLMRARQFLQKAIQAEEIKK